MQDQIIVITGANSGIGKAAADRFAREGYTVVMACRNIERSRKVQEELIKTSKNNRVVLKQLDVSSFDSIRQFCSAFKEDYNKLDILIHNAAYFNHGEKHRLSIDNFELTFATNVFGPYYMTTLLLDCLKKSEDARILHAGSNIIKHFFDPKRKIDLGDLQGVYKNKKKFSVYKMYCQSKMALVMLTFKLAKELESERIKVNALQINGAKMSKNTIQKLKPRYRTIAWIQNIFFPSPSYMADNYFELCTSDKFKHTTGKLLNDKLEVMTPSPNHPLSVFKQLRQITGKQVYPSFANDKYTTEKLWEICRHAVEE
ncbi:SDR family oxidoreductase [Alteribacillus bidgolensis]|uniref:NAD(P)-dependent dehydrogenase, short-chain alcohol dehydrogenase family n=1 Tax=Alteribacillus bidgolensis TaxID=930129 RepID=A0A1G8FYZ3_9BACI|nr:SDR family oxidoreductase [Alteribacillus bidgolensis]SDH87341.1 NAD(P)-dependent dehydrogenase, short-chain alcohol dehydrogenase family [Alteribacillus bidgolensis]